MALKNKMEELYHIAQKTNQYVNGVVLCKPTHPSENKLAKEVRDHHFEVIFFLRFEFLERYNSRQRNIFLVLPSYPVVIRHILKYNTGNCHECALLGYHFIKTKYPQVSNLEVQMVTLPHQKQSDNGHVFLRLSRGSEVVYCDPWANDFFAEAEKESKMKTYCYEDSTSFICPYEESTKVLKVDNCLENPIYWQPVIGLIAARANILAAVLREQGWLDDFREEIRVLRRGVEEVKQSPEKFNEYELCDAFNRRFYGILQELKKLMTDTQYSEIFYEFEQRIIAFENPSETLIPQSGTVPAI